MTDRKDVEMSVPRQVEEAAELAEQLMNKMNSAEEEVPQEEAQDEGTVQEDDTPQEDIDELRKYKERYLSLKGKYDAEVPRLHTELKEFKQNVFQRLETLTPKQEQEAPKNDPRLDKFKDAYGEELYELVDYVADLKAQQRANELFKQGFSEVQTKVESVEETQIKAAQQNYAAYLDDNVKGNWRDAWSGNDPKFLEFLEKPDPSGLYTYKELASHYNDQWDTRMANLFNAYFEASAPPAKKSSPAKEAMVAPSRTTAHNTPQADDKTIWTQESIREFERADRAGKFTPEESAAKWNDLLAAVGENRIRS